MGSGRFEGVSGGRVTGDLHFFGDDQFLGQDHIVERADDLVDAFDFRGIVPAEEGLGDGSDGRFAGALLFREQEDRPCRQGSAKHCYSGSNVCKRRLRDPFQHSQENK